MAPLMLATNDIPLTTLVAGLERAGIRVVPQPCHLREDEAEYVCRRGWFSFALSVFRNRVTGRREVWISADLSMWRRWDLPILWLVSIPLTPWDLRLQQDAYAVLRSLGCDEDVD